MLICISFDIGQNFKDGNSNDSFLTLTVISSFKFTTKCGLLLKKERGACKQPSRENVLGSAKETNDGYRMHFVFPLLELEKYLPITKTQYYLHTIAF